MAGKPRSPEFMGGHPKSNKMSNVANPSDGIVVGSQAPKKIEYTSNPKSKRAKGNGAVTNGRPID